MIPLQSPNGIAIDNFCGLFSHIAPSIFKVMDYYIKHSMRKPTRLTVKESLCTSN